MTGTKMEKEFIKKFIDILYDFHELYFVGDTYTVEKIWIKKGTCGFSDNKAAFTQLELISGKGKLKMKGWESRNDFCLEHGHNWLLTTSDNFRRCDRSGCGAVEKMVSGAWASVAEKQEKKKKSGKNSNFVQRSFF